jgi:hypothetical protein
MPRFAMVTIELPLDGGDIEDARVLADLIASKTLTSNPEEMIGLKWSRLCGRVANVEIEDRANGAMGRTAARRVLDLAEAIESD